MELYVLDFEFRRIALVDWYESLVWTERFNAFGDFELRIVANTNTIAILQSGYWLAMQGSYRVMQIRRVQNQTDADGRKILTVTGRSMEAILLDRVAIPNLSVTKESEGWNFEKSPVGICRQIFQDICVTGVVSSKDIIPNVGVDNPPWPSNIPYSTTPIKVKLNPTTVYDAIRELCVAYSLGFRLLRLNDSKFLSWDVYSGSDRTTSQVLLPPVVFSPQLDSLSDINELQTIEDTKNVAYVIGESSTVEVYADDGITNHAGLGRNVLLVDASDITTADFTNVPEAMKARGKMELALRKAYLGFDGVVRQDSQYLYQKDYFLGDLVEVRQETGATNIMRVSEQIFASDQEGTRMYPSLEKVTFVDVGTWMAVQADQRWLDLSADVTSWSQS